MSYGKFAPKMKINNSYNPYMSESWNLGASVGNLLGTLWGANYLQRGQKRTIEEAQKIADQYMNNPAPDSLYQDYTGINISPIDQQTAKDSGVDTTNNSIANQPAGINIGDASSLSKLTFKQDYIGKYKDDPNAVGNGIAGRSIADVVNGNLKNLNTNPMPSFSAKNASAAIEAQLIREGKRSPEMIAAAMKLINPQLQAKEEEYNANKSDELYKQYVASGGKDVKTLAALSNYNPQLAKILYDDSIYNRNRAATIADRNATFAQQKEMISLKNQAALNIEEQKYNRQRQRLFDAMKGDPDFSLYTDAQLYNIADRYLLGLNNGGKKNKNSSSGGNNGDTDPFAFGSKGYQQVLSERNALQKKKDDGMIPLTKDEEELLAQYGDVLKNSRKNAFGASEGVSKDVDFMLTKLQEGQASGMTNSQIKSSVLGAFRKGTPQYKAAEDAFTAAVTLSGAQQDPASMGMGLGYGNSSPSTSANATSNYGGGGGGYDSPSVTEAIISGTQSVEPQAPNNVADFRRANDNSPAPVTATVKPQGVLNSMGDFRMAEAAMPQNFVSRRQAQIADANNAYIFGNDAKVTYTPTKGFNNEVGGYFDWGTIGQTIANGGKVVGNTLSGLTRYLGDRAGMEISNALANQNNNYGDVPTDLQNVMPNGPAYGDGQSVMSSTMDKLAKLHNAAMQNRSTGTSYLMPKAEAAQMMPNLSPKAVQQVMDAENPDVVLYDKKPTTGNSQGITMFYADEASRNFNPGHSEGKEGIHYGASSLVNRVRDLYGLIPYRESDGTNCARTVSVALNGTPYSGMYNVDQFIVTARKNGQLYKAGEGYVPKAGDLAVTNNGGHIVMVTENGGTIQNGASGNRGKGGIYETNEPPEQQRGGVQYYISTSDYERAFPNFYFSFDVTPHISAIKDMLLSMKR